MTVANIDGAKFTFTRRRYGWQFYCLSNGARSERRETMAKVLNLDEMLEILKVEGDQHYHGFKAVLEATGKAMANVIADGYSISAGDCRSEGIAFAGTCACFKPSFEGQRCPEIFEELELDKGGDWEF